MSFLLLPFQPWPLATPWTLRLKCGPLGAPLPVAETAPAIVAPSRPAVNRGARNRRPIACTSLVPAVGRTCVDRRIAPSSAVPPTLGPVGAAAQPPDGHSPNNGR